MALASGAALIASSCCVLPLVLVAAGASGMWIGSLRVMQPYSESLALLSAALLAFSWKRILQPAHCRVEDANGRRRAGRPTRLAFWLTAGLTALMLSSPLWAPLFY